MSVPERPAVERLTNGQSIGIGSLPHRDADAAAAFSIGEFEIATIQYFDLCQVTFFAGQ